MAKAVFTLKSSQCLKGYLSSLNSRPVSGTNHLFFQIKNIVFAETSGKTAGFRSGFVMNVPHNVCMVLHVSC